MRPLVVVDVLGKLLQFAREPGSVDPPGDDARRHHYANRVCHVFLRRSPYALSFEAGQPIDAVKRGGLIALGQGWIVEDCVDEVVDACRRVP